MSEIIFPQQLLTPYELDYNNSIVGDLLSNNVGIFITDDNLTTVTNVVDGSAGVATDITNNEQGVVLSGYRVGVDTSSLTAQQQSDVSGNPYQLFKTPAKEREEYALTFDGVDDKITFSTITLTGDFEIEFDMWFPDNREQGFILSSTTYNGTNGFGLFYRNGDGFNDKMIQPYTSGSSRLNSAAFDLTPLDAWHNVKVTRTSGTMKMLVDDVQVGADWTDSNPLDLDLINGHVGYDNHDIKSKNLRVIDKVTNSNNRLWIFDKRDNPTVVSDEYNQAPATLVGSPVFERVLEKQVFSAGAGRDYADFDAFTSAQGSDVTIDYEVVLYDDWAGQLDLVNWSNKFQGFLTVRGAVEFNGDESAAGVVTITGSDATMFGARSDAGYNVLYQDLVIKDNEASAWVSPTNISGTGVKNHYMKRCSYENIPRHNISNAFYMGNWESIEDSVLKVPRLSGSGYLVKSLTNSIVVDNNFVTPSDANCIMTNIVYDTGGGSITETASITHTKNANGQGWFVDAANEDYSINSTGQTALQGQGWNGSDIASTFYAVSGELTITLGTLGSTLVIHEPTVIAPKSITLDTLGSTTVLREPVVTIDKKIEMTLLASALVYYSPTVSLQGAQTVTLNTLGSSSTYYSPTIANDKLINLSTLSSTSVPYAPSIVKDKQVSLASFVNNSVTYDPAIVSSKFVSLESFSNVSITYGVAVVQDKLIELPKSYSESTYWSPEVIGGYRPIEIPTLYTAEGYGLHIRSAEEINKVIAEMAKRIEILEKP